MRTQPAVSQPMDKATSIACVFFVIGLIGFVLYGETRAGLGFAEFFIGLSTGWCLRQTFNRHEGGQP